MSGPTIPELLPCPFCGGAAELQLDRGRNTVGVGCTKCVTTQTPSFDLTSEVWARRAWNTRTQPTTPVERTEQPVVDDGEREVNRVATLLLDTWKRVDPQSGVAMHTASYIANFADMARAIVADRLALTPPSAPLTPASSPNSTVAGVEGLRKALIEQEAIDLVVDLCGPGASQSGTNCRVVEDHLKQFARNFAALTASSTSGLADGRDTFAYDDEGNVAGRVMRRAQPDAVTSGMPDRPAAAPSEEALRCALESIARPFPAKCNWEDQARACQVVAAQALAALQPTPSTDSYTGAGE